MMGFTSGVGEDGSGLLTIVSVIFVVGEKVKSFDILALPLHSLSPIL
jgi:hypothetical protein